MTQHRRFSFDAANPPSENTHAINHGGMGVCSNQGVRIRFNNTVIIRRKNNTCKIFEIDLVTDARSGRDYLKVVKCLLSPFKKGVALSIPTVLKICITVEGIDVSK